jgi:CheY-like chemotaxis protein
VAGTSRPLPPGVELSAYRIVQEALSNAMRHAPGSVVRVEIEYAPAELGLRVVNGPRRAAASTTPEGSGEPREGRPPRRPDVVLMDVRMPVMNGLQATRLIVGGGAPAPKVLVLTTFDLDEYVYEALRAGASGFLLKDSSGQQLAEAVRVVAAGDALLAPR